MNGTNELLTREQILSMPAGREMDVSVYCLVMGGKGVVCIDGTPVAENNHDIVVNVPKYSNDIEAAWQVVEEIDKNYRPYNPVRISRSLSGWACGIRTRTYSHVVANADTVPLAVCRAALLAALEEESS